MKSINAKITIVDGKRLIICGVCKENLGCQNICKGCFDRRSKEKRML